MKNIKALIAVGAVLCGTFSCFCTASQESRDIYINKRNLSEGVVFTEKKFVDGNDNIQNSFIFEIEKDSETEIKVSYGEYIFGADKLESMVQKEETGGGRVIGAVNADFFSISTGVPMSLLIDEGKLISSDDGRCGLGIKQNGQYIIGYPKMTFSLTKTSDDIAEKQSPLEQLLEGPTENEPEVINIEFLNKYPSVYAKYLLTDDFAPSTKTASPNTEIVFMSYSEKFEGLPRDMEESEYFELDGCFYILKDAYPQLFGSEKLVVTEVRENSVDSEIPKGAYVLCLDDVVYKSEGEKISVGDEFTLDISADEEWKDVVSAVGNGGRIVKNSVYTDESFDSSVYSIKNPRTAAGITPEGKLIIYCVDGRRTMYSAGMTVPDLANQLIALGCSEAVNFDGGGSTTVYAALPGMKSAVLQNRPSDFAERKVSDSLMLINTADVEGTLNSVRMYPEVNFLLAGGSCFEIESLLGWDKNYHPVDISSPVEYFTNENSLIFEDNMCYTTDQKGEFTVYAKIDDKVYTCGSVRVLEEVENITLNIDKDSFYVDDTAKINVGAFVAGMDIPCLLSSFTYNDGSLEENYLPDEKYILKTERVTIDTEGNVTVLVADESITITAYYGENSGSVSFSALNREEEKEPEVPIYPETEYVDIDSHWAKQYIEKCRDIGLMSGENTEIGTIFSPDRNFSVAEFCTVVTRLCNFDLEQYQVFELPFEDKDEIAAWALPYIKAMYFNGKLDLVIENNRIRSSEPISRIDVMAVCGTLCPETDKSYIDFEDIKFDDFDYVPKKPSETALQNKLESVNKSLASGIFYGYDDNTLRPERSLSRAEGATVFIRLCKALGKID